MATITITSVTDEQKEFAASEGKRLGHIGEAGYMKMLLNNEMMKRQIEDNKKK